MYLKQSIMYTSDLRNNFINKSYFVIFVVDNINKISGICTNKMHNVEIRAFVTNSIGYRAKNDPGD